MVIGVVTVGAGTTPSSCFLSPPHPTPPRKLPGLVTVGEGRGAWRQVTHLGLGEEDLVADFRGWGVMSPHSCNEPVRPRLCSHPSLAPSRKGLAGCAAVPGEDTGLCGRPGPSECWGWVSRCTLAFRPAR